MEESARERIFVYDVKRVRERFQKNKINTRARAIVPSHTHTHFIHLFLPAVRGERRYAPGNLLQVIFGHTHSRLD